MHSFSRLKQKDKDIFFEKPFDSYSRMNKTETHCTLQISPFLRTCKAKSR